MKGSYDNDVSQKKQKHQMEIDQQRNEERTRIDKAQRDLDDERQRK
jgi:hypothetical protein